MSKFFSVFKEDDILSYILEAKDYREARQKAKEYYGKGYLVKEYALKTALSVIFCLILGLASPVFAQNLSEADILQGVLGEARSQSQAEMQGIAEVIRLRDSKKGIYGFNIDYSNEIPYMRVKGIIKRAQRAVEESKTSNLTNRATHFESTDFKMPYWAKDMEETAHIGKTKFYK